MQAQDLNAFVICLEKKTETRCDVNMDSILSVFPKCQRFSAVDASTLHSSDARISDFARYYMQSQIESDFMHLSKMGAVGCSLSHIALWKKCVELNTPIVVVEDDLLLTKKMQQQVRNAVSEIPNASHFAGLMYTPYNHIDQPRRCEGNWCRVQQGYAGTQMYYVTPTGCSILLRNALPIVTHIDAYIGYVSAVHEELHAVYWKQQIYTVWHLIKGINGSTIGHGMEGRLQKILPNSNAFYLTFFVVALLLLITVIVLSVCLSRCRGRR